MRFLGLAAVMWRLESVRFLAVLFSGDDLEIPGNVQAADGGVSQRNHVVNVIGLSSGAGHLRCAFIELAQRISIGPFRHRSGFGRIASLHLRAFPCWILARIAPVLRSEFIAIALSVMLGASQLLLAVQCVSLAALLAYFFSALSVVSTLLFDEFVALGPVGDFPHARSLRWMPFAPLLRGGLDVFAVLGSPLCFFGERLCVVDVAAQPVALAAFLDRHFCWSMWASMMRRTSSAMEIPRRLASRFKNALCGSVNEIICLVMVLPYVLCMGCRYSVHQFAVFIRGILSRSDASEEICGDLNAARHDDWTSIEAIRKIEEVSISEPVPRIVKMIAERSSKPISDLLPCAREGFVPLLLGHTLRIPRGIA